MALCGFAVMLIFASLLAAASMFFMLGLNIDTDQDGLSDSFERIISKTDPYLADTDGVCNLKSHTKTLKSTTDGWQSRLDLV